MPRWNVGLHGIGIGLSGCGCSIIVYCFGSFCGYYGVSLQAHTTPTLSALVQIEPIIMHKTASWCVVHLITTYHYHALHFFIPPAASSALFASATPRQKSSCCWTVKSWPPLEPSQMQEKSHFLRDPHVEKKEYGCSFAETETRQNLIF